MVSSRTSGVLGFDKLPDFFGRIEIITVSIQYRPVEMIIVGRDHHLAGHGFDQRGVGTPNGMTVKYRDNCAEAYG